MMTQIVEMVRQIGLADLLDIVLVAMLIFAILSWLRSSLPPTASRRIIVAVPGVAILYILVRVFHLYLLERIFQLLLVVLLIGAVVVFQSDIRRMLDRLIIRYSGRASEYDEVTIDVLTEVATKLAASKTGALIAIKGREPWDGHVHGGVQLEGLASQPLLLGIFQPDTPGHDGAVMMEGSKVVRFAAHLPLAPDLPEISRYGGTRHVAALGLAEECDAFIIVVSEESGTISIAQDGELTEDVSTSRLKERLETFWNRKYADEREEAQPFWRRPNVRVAIVSLVLAMMLWLLVVYSPYVVTRSVIVPVQFSNLPEDWMLEEPVPSQVEVILAGSAQVFRRLNVQDLAVTVDLSDPQRGQNEIAVTEEQLRLPPGIELQRTNPSVLNVGLDPTKSLRLPVRVRMIGILPDTLRLARLSTDPDSVTVRISESNDAGALEVNTSPIDLSEIGADMTIEKRIVPPDEGRMENGSDATVDVIVDVEPVIPE